MVRRTAACLFALPIAALICTGCESGGDPAPAPTVNLTANRTSIAPHGAIELTWTSENATAVASSNFGATTVSGTVSVAPSATTTYTLTVRGAGGQATAEVTVTVWSQDAVIYTATDTPAEMDPNWPYLQSTITVLEDTDVTDVKVYVHVTRPVAAHNWLRLRHAGTEIILHRRTTSAGMHKTYDDAAPVAYNYLQDFVRPYEPLGSFAGLSTQGDWTLQYEDDGPDAAPGGGGAVGTIVAWSLILNTPG